MMPASKSKHRKRVESPKKPFRFRGPVFNLTDSQTSVSGLREFGEVRQLKVDAEQQFIPDAVLLEPLNTINLALLYPSVAVIECYLHFIRSFGREVTLMNNAEDLGPYEVILRGSCENKQTFIAQSVRFETLPKIPLHFKPSVFYCSSENSRAIKLVCNLLQRGKRARIAYRLTHGACGARYWAPAGSFRLFTPAHYFSKN